MLCALWHCHDGAVDHLHPFRDPFTPCLEDFRQTVDDMSVSRNRLSVLKRYGGKVAEFCKETRYRLFESSSVSFGFHRWVLIWEDPHRRLVLRLGDVLVNPCFAFCYDVPKARKPPPSNFLSMWVHQSALPRFCSSLRLWGTHRAQRVLTPRQSRRM